MKLLFLFSGNVCRFLPGLVRRSLLFFLLSVWLFGLHSEAQLPWPAENVSQAVNLTGLSPLFSANLSGASWNETTRRLWLVVNNPGSVVCIRPAGTGTMRVDSIGAKAMSWTPGGDLEAICQANEQDSSFFVLVEDQAQIRQYAFLASGNLVLRKTWSLAAHLPAYSGGLGPEGLTFVPDYWLRKSGFQNAAGNPVQSSSGFGGLFFVAHQNGGKVYVFDLSPTSAAVVFQGAFFTGRDESSGLEFDRSTGKLFVWHNLGPNYAEVCFLSSRPVSGGRKFNQLKEFTGPVAGNLEGIAFTPACSGERWYFSCDDSNGDGKALLWYRQFQPCVPGLGFEVVDTSLCVGDSLRLINKSCGTCADDFWLWKLGETVVSGFHPAPVPMTGAGTIAPLLYWTNSAVDSSRAGFPVRIENRPVLHLDWHDTTVCQISDTLFLPQVSATWNGPFLQNNFIPDLSQLSPGLYRYTCTAGSEEFCLVSDSVRVQVELCTSIAERENGIEAFVGGRYFIYDASGRFRGFGTGGRLPGPGLWLLVSGDRKKVRKIHVE